MRAVDFLRPAVDFRAVDLRPVAFLRPVDLRAVDLAVDFLAPVDLRPVDFFLPVVFFAATPAPPFLRFGRDIASRLPHPHERRVHVRTFNCHCHLAGMLPCNACMNARLKRAFVVIRHD